MKKILFNLLIALILVQTASAKDYLVRSPEEFTAVIKKIGAGDAIVIANGTYNNWETTVAVSGTAKKHILIRAQTAGDVIFTGDVYHHIFLITGSYIELQGFIFKGCNIFRKDGKDGVLVDFFNSKNARLTACTFTGNTAKSQFMPIVIVSGYGEHNRVDNCSFIADVDNLEVQVKITKQDCPKYTLVDHNIFRDKPKVSWSLYNGGECVQVGQDPILLGNMVPAAIVRDNKFIHCNGEPEVISNKSTGNRYIKNYFEDCGGELVLRGGHDCLVDSNTFNGGIGGIRISGTGHTITNNTISNTKIAIRLMYGMAKGKLETGFYIAASNCVINNNHIANAAFGILVGDNKNKNWAGKFDVNRYPSRTMQDIAPFDNAIANNDFTHVEQEITYK